MTLHRFCNFMEATKAFGTGTDELITKLTILGRLPFLGYFSSFLFHIFHVSFSLRKFLLSKSWFSRDPPIKTLIVIQVH